jgi:hypothetical protein
MSCGDWLVRRMNRKYAILENEKAYAVLLSKKHYDENMIELIEAMIK